MALPDGKSRGTVCDCLSYSYLQMVSVCYGGHSVVCTVVFIEMKRGWRVPCAFVIGRSWSFLLNLQLFMLYPGEFLVVLHLHYLQSYFEG